MKKNFLFIFSAVVFLLAPIFVSAMDLPSITIKNQAGVAVKSVTRGESITVSWSSNGVSCNAYSNNFPQWSGAKGKSGSETLSTSQSPLGTAYYYLGIQCKDASSNFSSPTSVPLTVFSTTVVPAPVTPSGCIPSWVCGSWIPAICPATKVQTRNCYDGKSCGTLVGKPVVSQACTSSVTPSPSTPTTCSPICPRDARCGATDGCNGTCSGSCPAGQTCTTVGSSGGLTLEAVRSNAQKQCVSCTPKTCKDLGFDCGSAFDGCGGTLFCGNCPTSKPACNNNHCIVPGCKPQCTGKECGDDKCGGSCGTCKLPTSTCTDAGKCVCPSGGTLYKKTQWDNHNLCCVKDYHVEPPSFTEYPNPKNVFTRILGQTCCSPKETLYYDKFVFAEGFFVDTIELTPDCCGDGGPSAPNTGRYKICTSKDDAYNQACCLANQECVEPKNWHGKESCGNYIAYGCDSNTGMGTCVIGGSGGSCTPGQKCCATGKQLCPDSSSSGTQTCCAANQCYVEKTKLPMAGGYNSVGKCCSDEGSQVCGGNACCKTDEECIAGSDKSVCCQKAKDSRDERTISQVCGSVCCPESQRCWSGKCVGKPTVTCLVDKSNVKSGDTFTLTAKVDPLDSAAAYEWELPQGPNGGIFPSLGSVSSKSYLTSDAWLERGPGGTLLAKTYNFTVRASNFWATSDPSTCTVKVLPALAVKCDSYPAKAEIGSLITLKTTIDKVQSGAPDYIYAWGPQTYKDNPKLYRANLAVDCKDASSPNCTTKIAVDDPALKKIMCFNPKATPITSAIGVNVTDSKNHFAENQCKFTITAPPDLKVSFKAYIWDQQKYPKQNPQYHTNLKVVANVEGNVSGDAKYYWYLGTVNPSVDPVTGEPLPVKDVNGKSVFPSPNHNAEFVTQYIGSNAPSMTGVTTVEKNKVWTVAPLPTYTLLVVSGCQKGVITQIIKAPLAKKPLGGALLWSKAFLASVLSFFGIK